MEDKKEAVIEALKEVYDPEIPVNVYDLGLIYDIKFEENNNCTITMTLTTPLCPVAEQLPAWVTTAAAEVLKEGTVSVDLVFDPPWETSMISEDGKAILSQLGFPF